MIHEKSGRDSQAESLTKSSGAVATLLRTLSFSAEKHRLGKRKDEDGTPYINHPIKVATLLAEVGGIEDVEVLQAGILHDTIEDTETAAQELENEFGPRVRSLVEQVTDDKELPKQVRKDLQVSGIKTISVGARSIRIADKIANLQDIQARPPRDWSVDRKAAYLNWTLEVVQQCLGANPALEALYFSTYWRLRETLDPGDEEGAQDPLKFESEPEGVTEIGWGRGVLSDGVRFFLECWAEDGLTMLTYFLPICELEGKIPSHFEDLIQREGLLRFTGQSRFVDARRWTDRAGRNWWSVNVVAGDDTSTYVQDFVPLRPYLASQS